MKYFNTKYILLLLCAFSLTGCNYLDVDESYEYSKEGVISSYNRTKQLVTNVYGYLPDGFSGYGMGSAMHDAATDDAVHIYQSSVIQRFVDGTWSPNYTVDDVWAHYYAGIRAANFYLKETEGQTFEEWKYADDYERMIQNFTNYKFEVRFLRAFYYFELAKRYQNIPFLLNVLTQNEINNVVPSDINTVMSFVISECTDLSNELPKNYSAFQDVETGRITKGMALALKSRATLYMASPLYSTNNKDKWKVAAKAAYELISKANEYGYRLDKYANLYNDDNNKNAEVIFARPKGPSSSFESANYPMGAEGGNTSTCPTENLVSAYEMKDGSQFDWNDANMKKNPYQNRDPRLGFTIVYNDVVWPYDKKVEIWEGGANGLPLTNATSTGYYLRKYLNKSIDFRPGKTLSPKQHNWILFRYAEILLNYAEAMTNAFENPTYTDGEFPLSALDAVNMVRNRSDVMMPAIPNSITHPDFVKRIKNERRVEFAFEGQRFWDLRRWKDLDQTKVIYGVKIQKNGTEFDYNKFVLSNRIVSDKMYFYPISNLELNRNRNLKQNSGWN